MDNKEIIKRFPGIAEEMDTVSRVYKVAVTPYFFSLIQSADDAIGLQCLPAAAELDRLGLEDDPLCEDRYSPLPCLVHRYPDRVLLLVSDRCPVYCRFCTRKSRFLNNKITISKEHVLGAIEYISFRPEIKDVLISGGDPFMLDDVLLEEYLTRLKRIPHLDMIRIGSRVLSTWPERITPATVSMLRCFQPLYINTHFNHPDELTSKAAAACSALADAGIPLGNQTVLLKGVNDDSNVLELLFRGLLKMRVRPYYLHMMDLTAGTGHFRLSLKKAMVIYQKLQGCMGGMALPRLMLDLPGGGGKIALTPQNMEERTAEGFYFRNYQGQSCFYPEMEETP